MTSRYRFESLFASAAQTKSDNLTLFVYVNMGVIESLANGLLSPVEAIQQLYFAENCIYVTKTFRNKLADQIMGRGVQLPDLFDALPRNEAQREYLHELATMRSLCLQILDARRQVA